MSKSNENILLALLTGAAIGAGIGILYAPDKGTEIRKKIKKKAQDTTHDITDRLKHAKDELTKTADAKKVAFEEKLEDVISNMSYKADEIIAGLERKLEELKNKNAQFQKKGTTV
ncbi:YtxH domain-containing protein [Sediminicola luteus]|uniref:YtxH domain-containing protein n=1 Tax=Sediminicola luteus TaxID=319238 RepID=A0ABV2TSM6_9FLAO